MATEFILPLIQTTTKIAIGRWLKQVGDEIRAHEKLLEVHDAQFDWDVPAPADGTLLEIRAGMGAQVAAGAVIAVIDVQDSESEVQHSTFNVQGSGPETQPTNDRIAQPHDHTTTRRMTPVAARIAAAHQLDVAQMRSIGIGGRVMKADVLAAVAARQTLVSPPQALGQATDSPVAGVAASMPRQITPRPLMTLCAEIDLTRVAALCDAQQVAWQTREGFALTPLPFIVQAVVAALGSVPTLNAAITDEGIALKPSIHIGVAGIIIAHAEAYNLVGLARRLQRRAANDATLATFTLDVRAEALLATGFVPANHTAMLTLGALQKRAVVVGDLLQIHPIMYASLTFDPRAADEAEAARFLEEVRGRL